MDSTQKKHLLKHISGASVIQRLLKIGRNRKINPESMVEIAILHGEKNIPGDGHVMPPHIEEVVERVRQQETTKVEESMDRQEGAVRKLLAKFHGEIERIRLNRTKKLEELHEAEAEYQETREKRLAHNGKFHIGKLLNYIMLGALFVPELLLSSLIFEGMAADIYEKYAYAVPIGMSIPLLGHFLGAKARKEKGERSTLAAFLFVIPAVALILFTSIIRSMELTRIGLLDKGYWGSTGKLFLLTAFFTCVNTVIFVIAYGVSYNSHNRAIGHDIACYKAARRRLWIAQRLLNRLEKKYARIRQAYGIAQENLVLLKQIRFRKIEELIAWRDSMIFTFRMTLPLVNDEQTDIYYGQNDVPVTRGSAMDATLPEVKDWPDLDDLPGYDDEQESTSDGDAGDDQTQPAAEDDENMPEIKLVDTEDDNPTDGDAAAGATN